ncbi:Uncharacterised protein [Vibrio cholerae]|nr:Uncharacterised protein [Vibrio cholerae]
MLGTHFPKAGEANHLPHIAEANIPFAITFTLKTLYGIGTNGHAAINHAS